VYNISYENDSISYWRFVYFTPEYVSPFVLSKHDVRLPGVVTDEVSEVSDAREKTISLERNAQRNQPN